MNTYRVEVIDTDGDVVYSNVLNAHAPEDAIAAEADFLREDGRLSKGTEPPKYFSADNCPVVVGAKFWNNDLRVCRVTRLEAIPARPYSDTGETSTWHDTTHGMFDTLTGHMRQYGRLARWFQGEDAERYEPGTSYADIKAGR